MNELVFPLAGALAVFLVAVPLATLVAKGLLVAQRRTAGGLPAHGTAAVYALVIAPTLGPALWAISAALHQSEPGEALAACLVDQLPGDSCRDALLFAGVLTLILGHGMVRRLRRDMAQAPRLQRLDANSAQGRRLAAVCARHAGLARFAGRIAAVRGAREPLCTRRALRPVIEVDAGIMERLDDDALAAALLHEAEHARGLDPLRYGIAAVSLSLNPLARLLRSELAHWRLAREAVCDHRAVRAGADPLALAEAIVTAARQPWAARTHRPGAASAAAALAGDGARAVELRVRLLMEHADHAGAPPASGMPSAATVVLGLLLLLAMPHATETTLLDALHQGVETAVLGVD